MTSLDGGEGISHIQVLVCAVGFQGTIKGTGKGCVFVPIKISHWSLKVVQWIEGQTRTQEY